jgi:uncharacterized protein (DUF433 family)
MLQIATNKNASLLGTGFYTVPEAARLLRIPPLNIRRWLGGYAYKQGEKAVKMPPLWSPQLPGHDHHLELGFRDLIELLVMKSFIDQDLSVAVVRSCLDVARECVDDPRPFSTRRFQTDGQTIFLESLRGLDDAEVLDLKKKQYVIKRLIDRTFKDLDLSDDIVTSWRPYGGKKSIVVDPERAFGQPIAAGYGVPTVALAQAVRAEGSVERVTQLYDVPGGVVRDAVKFEHSLAA